VARRQAGHVRGLRRLHQAVGGEGLDGPEDDGLRESSRRTSGSRATRPST
jgi:hypothetical protein